MDVDWEISICSNWPVFRRAVNAMQANSYFAFPLYAWFKKLGQHRNFSWYACRVWSLSYKIGLALFIFKELANKVVQSESAAVRWTLRNWTPYAIQLHFFAFRQDFWNNLFKGPLQSGSSWPHIFYVQLTYRFFMLSVSNWLNQSKLLLKSLRIYTSLWTPLFVIAKTNSVPKRP